MGTSLIGANSSVGALVRHQSDQLVFGGSLQQWLKIQAAVQIPAENAFDKQFSKAAKHCLTNYLLSKDRQIAFSQKQ